MATEISILDDLLSGKGLMVAVIPKIKNTLIILDPTTLPTAISEFFLYAATTEVASSGREVPMATMVSPIKESLNPK